MGGRWIVEPKWAMTEERKDYWQSSYLGRTTGEAEPGCWSGIGVPAVVVGVAVAVVVLAPAPALVHTWGDAMGFSRGL